MKAKTRTEVDCVHFAHDDCLAGVAGRVHRCVGRDRVEIQMAGSAADGGVRRKFVYLSRDRLPARPTAGC